MTADVLCLVATLLRTGQLCVVHSCVTCYPGMKNINRNNVSTVACPSPDSINLILDPNEHCVMYQSLSSNSNYHGNFTLLATCPWGIS